MCSELDRVHDAQSIGVDVQSSTCRGSHDQTQYTCPSFERCAYQRQRGRRPDLWFIPHDVLFKPTPLAMGDIAALVVDEAVWRKGLGGIQGQDIVLSLGFSSSNQGGPRKNADEYRVDHLFPDELVDALRRAPDGPVQRITLESAGLTEEIAADCYRRVWTDMVQPELRPGMSSRARQSVLKDARTRKRGLRLARLWEALQQQLAPNGPALSGRVSLVTKAGKGDQHRELLLKWRDPVRAGWKVPTLLLDALLSPELVKFTWPDLEVTARVEAVAPFQHIYQVIDLAYSQSRLQPLSPGQSDLDAEEAQRRTNRLEELRVTLIQAARRYAPGKVLAVLQKRTKEALIELGSLPSNVELAHHNAVAGRDEWAHVAALFVVGRTLPPPGAVERIAEAISGRAVEPLTDWYVQQDAIREMADGTAVAAQADVHPDPLAEAVRYQICEGELIQIIGRVRGVNRTADDPVDVFVLTDVPLPIPLAGTLSAADLAPTFEDRMMTAGGVALKNARHAATAYPSLTPSHGAARKSLQASRSGSLPYLNDNKGKGSTPRFRYQLRGPGQKPAEGQYDPLLCPDLRLFLERALGPLMWLDVDPGPAIGDRA